MTYVKEDHPQKGFIPLSLPYLNRNIPQPTKKSSTDRKRGRRDAALIGLQLGCGLRRSEAVNLRFDQLQLRESHW
jgi:integrase